MRTNIDIDDALMAEAMKVAGSTSKKATVEEALQRMVALHRQHAAIDEMKGMGWQGDLDKMRQLRDFDTSE